MLEKISSPADLSHLKQEEIKQLAEEIRNELIDRFGDIPKATEDLIKVARLRSLAESIGLIKVTVRGNRMTLKYPKKDNVKDTVLLLSKKTNNLGEAADLLYVMSMKAKADA
jgi:transcription-repair coupling factor (superfamily II helicase)